MSLWLYVGIGLGLFFLVLTVSLFLVFKKKKRISHPLEIRARDMGVMIAQRIFSMNKRIQILDDEVTKFLMVKEKQDFNILEKEYSLDELQTKIDEKKEEIRILIGDIQDLENYKNEISNKMKQKDENWEKEVEELLDFVKEKMKYRFT